MFNPRAIGPVELIIVLVIVLVIFGAGRLTEIGSALGKGIREFRKATKDDLGAGESAISTTDQATPATPKAE